MKWLAVLAVAAGCGGNLEAAPAERVRTVKLVPVVEPLCVTHGEAAIGDTVRAPTMRAVALGASGDAAALEWIYRGETETTRALASGQARRQLGLKLRAQDSCNVIYVMWRLDPRPTIEVSLKHNPGKVTHADCGADGYTKLVPTKHWPVPALVAGDRHTLRAAIAGDDLTAWVDDRVVWRGALPAAAGALRGPVGIRSDNLAFELVALHAAPADAHAAHQTCKTE